MKEHIVQTQPHIALEDVWTKCEDQFARWFKTHVLRSMTTDDVVRALAMGPSRQVKSWNQYYVNGYNFQTQGYGQHKSTMNYGICVSSNEGLDYYGTLEEVIELVYLGNLQAYKTVLFNCNWMDSVNFVNIHPKYKLVEINHAKKYPKYDPFVLSYQANQVYFAPYPSLKRDKIQWWAVFKTKARSEIDAPVDIDFFQEEHNEHPSILNDPEDMLDYDNDGEEKDVEQGALELEEEADDFDDDDNDDDDEEDANNDDEDEDDDDVEDYDDFWII